MIWAFFAIMAAYVGVSQFVPVWYMLTFAHSIMFAVFAAVTVLFFPALIVALLKGKLSTPEYFIVGIICLSVSTMTMRGWSSLYRLAGRPPWMYENPIFGGLILIGIIGGIIILTSPGAVDGHVPTKNIIRASIVVAIGSLAGLLIVWLGTLEEPFLLF